MTCDRRFQDDEDKKYRDAVNVSQAEQDKSADHNSLRGTAASTNDRDVFESQTAATSALVVFQHATPAGALGLSIKIAQQMCMCVHS